MSPLSTDQPALNDSLDAISRSGWAVFREYLPERNLTDYRADLVSLYKRRRQVQRRNGIAEDMEGTCHHLLGEGTALDDLVAQLPLDGFIRGFFDGPYILNSFGGFMNTPGLNGGYIGRVHRDVRSYSQGFRLMINLLIMLDDFTERNGATYVLPQSHLRADKPSDDAFFDGAVRLLGRAGDVVAFDSRLWHAAGENRTTEARRALTLTYTRPFVKQQLDYPRYLGEAYRNSVSAEVQQVLGYSARVPDTIDAFYQPPERRHYRPDQG